MAFLPKAVTHVPVLSSDNFASCFSKDHDWITEHRLLLLWPVAYCLMPGLIRVYSRPN